MNADTLITAVVGAHDIKYSGDKLYSHYVQRMGGVNIARIRQADVIEIVQPFLYRWGVMGRLLGQARFNGWQSRLAQIIGSHSRLLGQFQGQDITGVNLRSHGSDVVTLYESVKGVVGQIAAAKVLNLVCPDFFPLWDNAIASAMRAELANMAGYSFNSGVEAFSGEDYLRFMEGVQLFISRHSAVISVLANQYSQRKLKTVDACFWYMTGRPFFLVF